jgi:hypothetical protein
MEVTEIADGKGMLFSSIVCNHPFHCHAYAHCAYVPDTLPLEAIGAIAGNDPDGATAVHVIPARHLANEIRLRREYAMFSGIGARLTREAYDTVLAFERRLGTGPALPSSGLGFDAPTPEEWTSGTCDFFGPETVKDDDDDD